MAQETEPPKTIASALVSRQVATKIDIQIGHWLSAVNKKSRRQIASLIPRYRQRIAPPLICRQPS